MPCMQAVARDAAEMHALLGMEAGDRLLGFFCLGKADQERIDGYRGSRGPVEERTVWRE